MAKRQTYLTNHNEDHIVSTRAGLCESLIATVIDHDSMMRDVDTEGWEELLEEDSSPRGVSVDGHNDAQSC